MNFYEVLGVATTANDAEITEAYRRLAAQFHPDRHPEASPAERMAWTQAMATINEAYAALRGRKPLTQGEEAADGRSDAPIWDVPPRSRRPFVGECDLCGSMPARPLRFRQQTAFIFRAVVYSTELELCRSCGLAVGRSRQNRTLLTGWWGILSFFRNLWVVVTNAVQLRRAAGLSQPRKSEQITTPLPSAMPSGRGIFLRSGVWATLALFVVIGSVISTASEPTAVQQEVGSSVSKSSNLAPPAAATPQQWQVGACLAQTGSEVYPVSCSEPHDAIVRSTALTSAGCPVDTEWWVEEVGFVWCVDQVS